MKEYYLILIIILLILIIFTFRERFTVNSNESLFDQLITPDIYFRDVEDRNKLISLTRNSDSSVSVFDHDIRTEGQVIIFLASSERNYEAALIVSDKKFQLSGGLYREVFEIENEFIKRTSTVRRRRGAETKVSYYSFDGIYIDNIIRDTTAKPPKQTTAEEEAKRISYQKYIEQSNRTVKKSDRNTGWLDFCNII